jgi:hypothetical protein
LERKARPVGIAQNIPMKNVLNILFLMLKQPEHFARDSELKVYKDILKACVHAFNLLPNTRLGFQGFNNTYALASKIDSLLEHEKKNI